MRIATVLLAFAMLAGPAAAQRVVSTREAPTATADRFAAEPPSLCEPFSGQGAAQCQSQSAAFLDKFEADVVAAQNPFGTLADFQAALADAEDDIRKLQDDVASRTAPLDDLYRHPDATYEGPAEGPDGDVCWWLATPWAPNGASPYTARLLYQHERVASRAVVDVLWFKRGDLGLPVGASLRLTTPWFLPTADASDFVLTLSGSDAAGQPVGTPQSHVVATGEGWQGLGERDSRTVALPGGDQDLYAVLVHSRDVVDLSAWFDVEVRDRQMFCRSGKRGEATVETRPFVSYRRDEWRELQVDVFRARWDLDGLWFLSRLAEDLHIGRRSLLSTLTRAGLDAAAQHLELR